MKAAEHIYNIAQAYLSYKDGTSSAKIQEAVEIAAELLASKYNSKDILVPIETATKKLMYFYNIQK